MTNISPAVRLKQGRTKLLLDFPFFGVLILRLKDIETPVSYTHLGNGRLHRCLIHHVLMERKFTPPGMVFPVSSVMLKRIEQYRDTLQAHSSPLMNFIDLSLIHI